MTARLPENLDLIATAPDGIQKLRGLILELAVRGKLVPQDPNDEPASELLKQIGQERARLETEGTCKKSKSVQPVSEDEQPFVLPNGWRWVRLSQIGHDWGQETPEETFTYIDVSAIDNALGKIDTPTVVAPEDAPSRARKLVKRGTVIYSTVRPYLLNISVVDRDFNPAPIASTAFAVLHPLAGLSSQYIFWYLRSPVFVRYVESVQTGIAYPAVNDSQFFSGLFPLPPLAEQHRIVAKVDELMALCDRLEAEQADAGAAHARLVATLLGTLTQSTDAAELAANWQRLAEHFDTLFTTEASLDSLKQTILQLAVMGKLVPQLTTCVDHAADGNGLPASWRLERIEGFCNVQGGIQKTPLRRPVKNHFPYLRVANVQRGDINVDQLARYELTQQELERWRLNAGDLLVVEGNGSESEIGRCAVWRGQVADCVYQNHLIRVRPNVSEQVDYLQLFLNSPVGIGHMKRLAITTSGLFNLSVGKIRGIVVPLPPLAEQHRIVAKVDELLALCDRLKADLAESRAQQERLAATLIESALQAA